MAETWVGHKPINTGPESESTHILLRAALGALRREQRSEMASVVSAARIRACDLCGCAIFFAKAPSGKWLPMETDTVPAAEILPAWRYIVNFDQMVNGKGEPTVRVYPSRIKGDVWVEHHQTCGVGEGPRWRVGPLVRRWQVNAERAERLGGSEQLHALEAMQARFAQTPTPE